MVEQILSATAASMVVFALANLVGLLAHPRTALRRLRHERRSGSDRRVAQVPFDGWERRSGIDRRAALLAA
jgi:hypothetical protein